MDCYWRLISVFALLIFSETILANQPDRLFYSSFRAQDWDIYLSTDSGVNFSKVTNDPTLDYEPTFSPDGRWLIFTSERNGNPSLFIKSTEAPDIPARLLIDSNAMQDQAQLSPDGKWLVFVSTHEGNADIYRIPFLPEQTLSLDQAENLTKHPAGDYRPSISPDGSKIAFTSDRAHAIKSHPIFPFARSRTGDIFVTDIEGRVAQRLTNSDAWDGSATWNEDGTKIYFYSSRDGRPTLFSMHLDGAEQLKVNESISFALSPVIISDDKIGYIGKTDQWHSQLYIFEESNEQSRPLIDSDNEIYSLAVGPKGLMAFHGGVKSPPSALNAGGLNSEPLVNPVEQRQIEDRHFQLLGVQRAFAAPPDHFEPSIYYLHMDAKSELDTFSVWFWPAIIFIPIGLILFITGIVQSIRQRQLTPWWKFILFSLVSLLLVLGVYGALFYGLIVMLMTMNSFRLLAFALFIALAVLAVISFRRYKTHKASTSSAYKVSSLYVVLFVSAAITAVYVATLSNHFFKLDANIYKVNYQSNEVEKIGVVKKASNTNPAYSQNLDAKVSADGKSLIVSMGSFRSGPLDQGDILSFDLSNSELSLLSDSNANDAFYDTSLNGSAVFRSGRNGHFDIYWRHDNQVTNLTNDVHRDNFPAISPQGDKIVFASDRGGEEYGDKGMKTMKLYLMEKQEDGRWSEPAQISYGLGQYAHPYFSTDGEWLAYTTEAYGINDEQPIVQSVIFNPQMYGEIVIMRLSDRKIFRLTHNKWEEGAPIWVGGIKEQNEVRRLGL